MHTAGTMSCWIQTGFPQVSKGTAGSVLDLLETADLEWGEAPVGATCNFSCSRAFWKSLSRFEMQFQILTLISVLCLFPHKQSYYYLLSGPV